LDYILIPTVTAASAAVYIREFYPQVPYAIWLLLFAVTMGLLNLLGVELMAKLGMWMVVIGEIVVFAGFFVWAYYVVAKHGGTGTLISSLPFKFTSISTLAAATSISVLSYLGFDAITTLAEETENPKKDIPTAIFISIIVGAFTMALTGYLGVLVIPNWAELITKPGWAETALFQVSVIAGGRGFAAFYTAGYLLAMAVFNVVATAAGARLLYGMGRDGLIPKGIFAAINKKYQTPHYNIILIVIFEYIVGMSLSIAKISTLINYGALGGFIALNLGVIWLYYIKKKGVSPESMGEKPGWVPTGSHHFLYFVSPILGIAVLVWVFLSLDKLALTVGTIWLVIGVVYEAIKTKGWKELPPQLEL
ncbi:MAG: APC family permease, partial [Methanomassiliicoccales archaeon]